MDRSLRLSFTLIFVSMIGACSIIQREPLRPSEAADLAQARRPNTRDPQWVIHQGPQRVDAALVFVHGIFGDTLGTWEDEHSGLRFYEMLAADPLFRNRLDMFMFRVSV
jgi:hypothetical protein